jgi:type II secretory pathway pseudopilin PulG
VNAHSKWRYASAPARQLGQAFLLVVLLLVVGIGALIFSLASRSKVDIERDRITAEALAQARQALIGRAVADINRPGSLVCPDTDDDGSAELMSGSDCPSYIGRLPWRTLGLSDLRDGEGERLWYALSNRFRDDDSAMPINSDTKGNRTVYSGSTAVALTAEAVAVVFAPGGVTGAQNRSCTVGVDCTASGQCTTSPASLTPKCNPANYLDATGGANNATTAGPFISAPRTSTFNDRLLVITTAELMPPVEQRVARELRAILMSYKAAVGAYPWADCTDGESDAGANRGRIPWQKAYPEDWGSSGAPNLPSWFNNNNWSWVIYYTVGKNYLEGGGSSCSTDPNWGCEPGQTSLSVNGVWGKEVVFIMTGPAGASRPLGTIGDCNPTYWQAYLEDPENNDVSNDRYVTPASTAYARDRLYTIP